MSGFHPRQPQQQPQNHHLVTGGGHSTTASRAAQHSSATSSVGDGDRQSPMLLVASPQGIYKTTKERFPPQPRPAQRPETSGPPLSHRQTPSNLVSDRSFQPEHSGLPPQKLNIGNRQSPNSGPESDDPLTSLTPSQFYSSPSSLTPKHRPFVAIPSKLSSNISPRPRPVGRPPNTGSGSNSSSSNRLVVEIRSSPHKKIGRPLANPALASTPLPKKKKGRPFAAPESAVRAAAKAAAKARGETIPRQHYHPGSTEVKKRGRPFKIREHVELRPPYGPFSVYACEWKGCEAKLMNMDVLRHHMRRVHSKKRPDAVWQCLWGKCGMTEAEREARDTAYCIQTSHDVPSGVFQSRQELKAHVEEKHLVPFSWHMGDGPKASCSGAAPGATAYHSVADMNLSYLFDSDGDQLTPSVFDKSVTYESGRAKDNNGRRFKRLILEMNHGREPDKKMFANMMVAKSAIIESEETSETGMGSPEGGADDQENGIGMEYLGDESDDNAMLLDGIKEEDGRSEQNQPGELVAIDENELSIGEHEEEDDGGDEMEVDDE